MDSKRSFKVLLVDDERLARESMREYIPWENLGMEVPVCLENGALALDYLKKYPVDILIMDIRMPVMDGLELLENIRALGMHLLIIVLSAYDQFEYAQKAIQSQLVYEYVLKPIRRKEFCELLRRAALAVPDRLETSRKSHDPSSDTLVRRRFNQSIRQHDLTAALQILGQHTSDLDISDENTLFEFRRFLLVLHTEIILSLSSRGFPGKYMRSYDIMTELSQCSTKEDLLECFTDMMEDMRPIIELDAETSAPRKSQALIGQSLELIQQHYAESNYSLQMLAEEMQLSTSYLSTLFNKEMDMGFVRYLNSLRIERAKQLLHDMRLRVGEIASQVGFESPRYFTRVFKEFTGLSPAEYGRRVKSYAHRAGKSRPDNEVTD